MGRTPGELRHPAATQQPSWGPRLSPGNPRFRQGLETPPGSISQRRATSTSYLCAKKDGVAKGKSVTVMLRSLTARLTMKNSAGFSVDRLR